MTVSLTVIPVWRWSSLGTVQIPSGPLMTSMNLPEYILLNLVDISVQFYLKTHVFLSSLLETSMIIFFPVFLFVFCFVCFLKQSLIMQPRITLNSQQFYWSKCPHSGIADMHHHTQLLVHYYFLPAIPLVRLPAVYLFVCLWMQPPFMCLCSLSTYFPYPNSVSNILLSLPSLCSILEVIPQ